MVDGILRTNSGFMHDVDTLRSRLTDPETVISLGDRDLQLGRTHAASDLMRQIRCFDCTEVGEGSDAHPDRREAPRSSLRKRNAEGKASHCAAADAIRR
jgi:hypothetical protein